MTGRSPDPFAEDAAGVVVDSQGDPAPVDPALVDPAPADAFDAPPPLSAATVAERAVAFERRMATLAADVDASWQREFAARAPALDLLPAAGAARASALDGLLRRFCGPAPSLDRLAAGPAQLALQVRPAALRALCQIALARRPGVLRCCVDRDQKLLLQHQLGDALVAIEALGEGGRPVSHEATGWTPLHWSCLGYLDWLGLMTRDDTFLRRLVRLLLPRGLLDMPQRLHLARADHATRDAVARLGAAGVHWPC